MHPRFLQSLIHNERSSVLEVWEAHKTNVLATYVSSSTFVDLDDHLVREFNRRVYNLGFASLLITPYDGGFRLTQRYSDGGGGRASNALVYGGDGLVYGSDIFVYGA